MMTNRKLGLASILMMSTAFSPGIGANAQSDAMQDGEIDEVFVQGQYIPNSKRVTSEISTSISEEDFKVQGDSDVASALTRVTGLSLSRGKFIYVRGLNERYSTVLLNGSPLPSPEPLRRVAPLDLIPTSVLSSVLVQKTYSPEYSGETGGGVVDLRTMSVPDENFREISISGSLLTDTSRSEGLLYDGGGTDWLGLDDGTRNLPAPLAEIFGTQRVGNSLDPLQQQAIGRSLVNSPLWVMQEGSSLPLDFGLNLQAGGAVDKGSYSVGMIASVGYDNGWQNRNGKRAEVAIGPDGLEYQDDMALRSTENKVELNGFTSIGVDIGDNTEIKLTGLGVRSTSKEARSLEGFDRSEGAMIRADNLEWFEREVWITQLQGKHFFGNDASVQWRLSHSEATRDAPYEREVLYELEGDTYRYKGTLDGNTTNFSKIEDQAEDIGIDALLPLGDGAFTLKAGYASYEKDRDAWSRQFSFESGSVGLPQELLYSRIDYIFADQNITDDRLRLVETGGLLFPEAYTGSLKVDAWYLGSEIEFTENLRGAIGFRSESSDQVTDTFNKTLPDNGEIESVIGQSYVLPAATFTWTFGEDMQMRLGYSQTIIRPQFRELAFAQFINTETDLGFQGNPFLKNSEMTNYDARWERYFGHGEFVTIGGFYKKIDKPIEEYVLFLGEDVSTSFINAPSATLMGVEFEYAREVPVKDWVNWKWASTKDFTLKANYTYSQSEVSAKGTVDLAQGSVGSGIVKQVRDAAGFVVDGRQMQGLSEALANVQFGYEDYEAQSRLTFLLNFTGERTRAVEDLSSNLPSIQEQLPTTLDIVYSKVLTVKEGAEYELGFKVNNVLGEGYTASQSYGGTTIDVDTYDIGRKFTLSLKRRF